MTEVCRDECGKVVAVVGIGLTHSRGTIAIEAVDQFVCKGYVLINGSGESLCGELILSSGE